MAHFGNKLFIYENCMGQNRTIVQFVCLIFGSTTIFRSESLPVVKLNKIELLIDYIIFTTLKLYDTLLSNTTANGFNQPIHV